MTRVASRDQTAEVSSRHERESRAVGETGQDGLTWRCRIFARIHANVSLHMHTGNAECYISPSLAPWVNPNIFFVCSLSSQCLDCISCSYEEMCDTPIGTTSWSPAVKRNGFEEVDVWGGARGYCHTTFSRKVQNWKIVAAIWWREYENGIRHMWFFPNIN